MREKSDYEDFYEPDREDAETVIIEVKEFIANVKSFLDEKINELDKQT